MAGPGQGVEVDRDRRCGPGRRPERPSSTRRGAYPGSNAAAVHDPCRPARAPRSERSIAARLAGTVRSPVVRGAPRSRPAGSRGRWPTTTSARSCIELEPEAGRLYDRHAKVAQEWFPHEYIPYRLGRDFDKEPWTPDQPRLTGVAQTAFEIGLLTEDNLPSYHRLIHGMFGRGDGAWINWVGRWTAEEGRHAIVLRDYLTVTRNIDPVAPRARPDDPAPAGLRPRRRRTPCTAWPTWRSRSWRRASRTATPVATRTIRWPTGSWSASPPTRTCTWSSTATSSPRRSRSQPSAAVRAIVDEVLAFKMPGAGIPRLRPQGRPDREGRHLRHPGPPRRGAPADPPPLAHLRADRPRRRRRGGASAPGRAPRRARPGGEAVRGTAGDFDRAEDPGRPLTPRQPGRTSTRCERAERRR